MASRSEKNAPRVRRKSLLGLMLLIILLYLCNVSSILYLYFTMYKTKTLHISIIVHAIHFGMLHIIHFMVSIMYSNVLCFKVLGWSLSKMINRGNSAYYSLLFNLNNIIKLRWLNVNILIWLKISEKLVLFFDELIDFLNRVMMRQIIISLKISNWIKLKKI